MYKVTTKILCLLTALAFAVGLLPGLTAPANADQIPYMEASYAEGTGVTYTSKTAEATALTSSSTSLNGGWYYVTGNVTVSSLITVTGTVNLILCDGATLTASKGINVASGQTLNIYAQEGGTGVLTSTGSGSDYQAGIGGGHCAAGGTVVIHGGTVNATGASVGYNDTGGGGAGIGGGGGDQDNPGGSGGTVIIYGGTVNANGGTGSNDDSQLRCGAGIGGGSYRGPGGSITIYGGTVTAAGANGYDGGAGLGGGDAGSGGTINIYGGTVTANGSGSFNGAAGIGGGTGGYGSGGTVNIYGGTVTATGSSGSGSNSGAGIGGGRYGAGGTVTISGGTVTANGGNGAQGIGKGASGSESGTLTVGSGLTVYGDDNNSDPTTVITDYATTRYRYMKVVPPVSYVEMNFDVSTSKLTSEEKTVKVYTVVAPSTTAWTNGGWYVVNSNVTVSSRITVTGTANLILCDGATLTANAGINVASDQTLNIYAQGGGTGTLIASGGSNANAGIGGGDSAAGGNVNIHGGTVTATGGAGAVSAGAGIGGGDFGNGGTVTIYGGTVTATGGESDGSAGAGIGGGDFGNGGTVTIYGGTVTANGGNGAQGIGQGLNGSGSGSLTVKGDVVVLGGSNANPTTVIPNPQSNRYRYMKAVKGYTVSFDRNASNATGAMSPQIVTASSPSLTLTANAFERSSYTFGGWNTSADGTGTSYADRASITLSKSLTLYAQWTAVKYTIHYDLDGGTDGGGATSYDIEHEVKLPQPTKKGYDFTGWSGDGITGQSTDVTIPEGSSGDRTYKANWQIIKYTLSYTLNGGTNDADNPNSYTVESETVTLKAPTRTGYTFAGWTADGKVVTEIAKGSTGDKTLTANWGRIIYTLEYDLNGGTLAEANPNSYSIESGDFKLLNPTKNGYEFIGWEYDGTLSTDLTITKGTVDNRKYTANWRAIEYVISYDLDGGTVSPDNPVKYTIESDDFRLTNPTKDGCEFKGWTGSADVETSMDVVITKGSTGNRSYTATYSSGIAAPVLTATVSTLELRRGIKITPLKVVAEQGTELEWSTSGELPIGLSYSFNDYEFVISGTVSVDAEVRDYSCTVTASNAAGSDSKVIAITVTSADAAAPGTVETTEDEINNMSPEELQETFSGATNIVLTGKVENLSQVLTTLGTVTTVKELDLSLAEGLTEVKLDGSNSVETLTLTGNTSVKTVEVTGNTSLRTLNLIGSKVETVDAKGCGNLVEVNVEGCETLEYLDVSETPITSLNVQGCVNLWELECASCDISDLRIEGCEKLAILNCSNNSLARLDLTSFNNLAELECRHQHIRNWQRSRRFNMLDILFMRVMNVLSAADVEVDSSDVANVKNIKAYDENGQEIAVTYNDETGEVTLSKVPAEIRYDYITGFNDVLMDVTVSASGSGEPDIGIYHSGSGCDTGLGFGMMMLMLMWLYRIHRRYLPDLAKRSTGK